MTRHYPDLGSASDWSWHVGNLIQPIRRTTQIWAVPRHQYGISLHVSQTSFRGETSGSVAKCRLFSQVTLLMEDLIQNFRFFNKVGHYWSSIRKKGKEKYDRPRNFYRDIRPRTGCVQVRTGLAGQLNRCQPENDIKLYHLTCHLQRAYFVYNGKQTLLIIA